MHNPQNSLSKHFVLHQLAEGVFSAIAENGGFAICNAGLIDLGGQILVFDTFLTPQAAMDLQHAAIDLFGRTPQIVINSHYHNDHIWGNQVFAGSAQIVSSTRTRELIATAGMEEFQWYSSNAAERLDSLRTQYQKLTDEQQRWDLLLWIGEYGGIVEALPTLKVSMPDITFNNYLEIHGLKRTVILIAYEGAHTGSDTVLYLPQEGIIFMSDLLFVDFHPYLADGDPLQLQKALKDLKQLGAVHFVPGHGPVGTNEDLEQMIAYIDHCLETARMLVQTGSVNEDKVKELKIPEKYQHWQMIQFYRSNILYLCNRLS